MKPICLIIPPSPFLLDQRVFVSLGILRVAACLEEAGVPVEMVDLSGINNFTEAMSVHAESTEAVCFGITATTPQMPMARDVRNAIKAIRPNARVILGGPHVTLVNAAAKRERKFGINGRALSDFRQLDEMFDVLVVGDGDDAIFLAIGDAPPRLIDADDPSGTLFLTNERLNALPWPARHLLDLKSYHYSVDGVDAQTLVGQLGCPYASVSGDTLVFTNLGMERIEDIAASGKDPISETCKHGSTITKLSIARTVSTHQGAASAAHAIDEGVREVVEIVLENGFRVRATHHHPFSVVENEKADWKRVSQIKVGDWVVIQQPDISYRQTYVQLQLPALKQGPPGGFEKQACTLPTELTPDLAWLAGFIIGDGCLPKDNRPAMHIALTEPTKSKVITTVKELFGLDVAVSASIQTTKMEHGWIHSRMAREFFVQSLGIDPHDKLKVPEVVARSPVDVIQSFLTGLFDADAYEFRVGREYLMTISRRLAEETALLMLCVGKPACITEVHAENGIHYRVSQFYNDRIPSSRRPYFSKKGGGKWSWGNKSGNRPQIGFRRRTTQERGLFHPLDIPGRFYMRVEAINPRPPERVFDLHVPGPHSFIANGISSGNCGFCGGRESPMLRRIRTRTTENIVGEIEHIHKSTKSCGLMFYDDELNVNPSMIGLMRAIEKKGEDLGAEFRLRGFIKSQLFTDEQAAAMYAAGFRWILVGFESGSERILTNINKKATRDENTRCMEIATRHGLKVKALMSIGHPGESHETVAATRDWLLEVKPADFDVTIITTYPGTPYRDQAVKNGDAWTYTYQKTGDKLHAIEIDFMEGAAWYKGQIGAYKSYVYTDFISADELVKARDATEADVRRQLGIPFNQSAAAQNYEHSMGQGLPGYILKTS